MHGGMQMLKYAALIKVALKAADVEGQCCQEFLIDSVDANAAWCL